MIQAFFFDLQAINAGKLAPAGHRAVEGHQGRRPRRRDDGRRHRLRLRPRRHGGRAQGRRRRERREGQGLLGEAARQGDLPRSLHRGEEGRAARPDHGRPPTRPTSRAATWSSRPSSRTRRSRRRSSPRSCRTCNPDALLCSNTSTLPITELADRRRPARGLHRPALLLARRQDAAGRDHQGRADLRRGAGQGATTSSSRSGRRRSSSTTAAASTPRGSSASWSTRAWRCSPRACTPTRSSAATTQAGYPAPVLQLSDELNLELMAKIAKATKDAAEREGRTYGAPRHRGRATRCSRPAAPAGSAAPASTTTTRRQPRARSGRGSPSCSRSPRSSSPFRDIKDRMLFAEALETAKCFEEGVIESAAAANIGSIMGIGFPPMTGGAAQFMTGYQDPRTPTARSAWRRSSSGPTSSPRRTATGSGHAVAARPRRQGRGLPGLTSQEGLTRRACRTGQRLPADLRWRWRTRGLAGRRTSRPAWRTRARKQSRAEAAAPRRCGRSPRR